MVTWLLLNLCGMNWPVGVISVIHCLFLFSFPWFDIGLFTLITPIHSLLVLFKVLTNAVEGKKVETKATGANAALDYLWILNIPSIPDPSNRVDDLVFQYMKSHGWLIKTHHVFMIWFQEQLVTVPVFAGAPSLSPMGAQPCPQLLSLSVGMG